MRWSKVRQMVEGQFAPSLAGRVRLESTHYHKSHDGEGRVGIVIDGVQVWCMGCIEGDRAPGLMADDLHEREGIPRREAYRIGDAKAHDYGFVSQYDFHQAVWDLTQVSIDDALASPSAVLRALAYMDARTGKRRLVKLAERAPRSSVERQCLKARLEAESIAYDW